jgi:hypothetical protein
VVRENQIDFEKVDHMKKITGSILLLALALTLVLSGISCTFTNASTPTPTDTTTTPTPTQTVTQVPFLKLVEDFIKNSSTFKFDGIDGSLKLKKAEEYGPISVFRSMVFTCEFQTRHPGHGDRSGMMLAQVITTHTAVIYVDVDIEEVRIAACDETWDMMKDIKLPPTPTIVSGLVISGGDTTPEGLIDAPRRFVYRLEKDDHTDINVSYTAYPPSPVGDTNRKKITLSLYDSGIKVGDYMKAYGTYDKDNDTVVVANEGDYIKTCPQNP